MIDVRKSHEVLEALGQGPLDAIGIAVGMTKGNQDEYRRTLPHLSKRHGSRGWLNWIHDQFFANLLEACEGLEGVSVRDREPIREVYFGSMFRFRYKKHDEKDMVSSYPTPGFLDFAEQDPPQLLQEIRLIGGYRWDRDMMSIGAPLVSARDGRNKVLWVRDLEAGGASGDDPVRFTPKTPSGPAGPDLPMVAAISGKLRQEAGSSS